jgi:hypothetical protein
MLGSVAPSLPPSCVWNSTIILQWNVVQQKYFCIHEWSIMMHTMINDVNCFPNKLLAVIMFELPLCSQVQWLENAVATGGETQLSHSLHNIHLGYKQHSGPQKVKSFCTGNSLWQLMQLHGQ